MTKTFNPKKFITQLIALGERQLEQETKACNLILKELDTRNVKYKIQDYTTQIPKYEKYSLVADGKKIKCLPSGFVSGKIESNFALISSLISSQKNIYTQNINFNPASKAISRSNHYFAPALSIAFSDILKVGRAKKIVGELVVKKVDHKAKNILVGNTLNPKNIIFSHFDSIGCGAVDNASGVALSLEKIFESPELLSENLFAICANEEISYDETIYWGHGYRVFEDEYVEIIDKAQKIIVVDCIGYTSPVLHTDTSITVLGFPIKNIQKYAHKISMLAGDFKKLMDFYHTNDDTPKVIKDKFYAESKGFFEKMLK